MKSSMLKMKRVLSILMVLFFVIILSTIQAGAWTAPSATDWQQLDRNNIKARFFIGSDIHIGGGFGEQEKLANALNVFNSIDPNMDAVIFDGDSTNKGKITEYSSLLNIVTASPINNSKIQYVMGNHEFLSYSNNASATAAFESATSQKVNRAFTLGANKDGSGGITFIILAAGGSDGNYTVDYDFLKNSLEKAAAIDATAPIFVIAHHSIKDTAYVSEEWNGNYGEGTTYDMVKLMAQYPQVIHFSGHSHSTVDDARSIDQSAGFTAIQDGTLGAYFENESGKILPDGSFSTYPQGAKSASQADMVEIDNNNKVTIKRMDLTCGKYIYNTEPWVIDSPALVNNTTSFTYTKDRAAKSKSPVFPQNAAIDVTASASDSVNFNFGQAASADKLDSTVAGDSNLDIVHSYKMQLTNVETGKTVDDSKFDRNYWLRWSDYYEGTHSTTLTQTLKGLRPNTQYKLEIWALTSFGTQSSNSLTTTFTTPALAPILDVDFSDGTAKDNSTIKHTAVPHGEPTISMDDELKKNVAKFDGVDDAFAYNLTTDDFSKIQNNFTMECMFKLDEYKNGDMFMDCDGSGLGFELNGDGHTLEFYARINKDKYSVPTVDIADIKAQWIHAVATFNGYELDIYINGRLATKMKVSGTLVIPKESARWIMIGADSSGEGKAECLMAGKVSTARLFGVTMNSDDVAQLYTKDTGKIPEKNYSVEISGTAMSDNTLTAMVNGADSNAAIEYQWFRKSANEDTAISGAIKSTYTLTSSDVGYTVYVIASITNGSTVSVKSEPTSVITSANPPVNPSGSLSALAVSAGELSPSFSTSTSNYSVSVGLSVDSITITPTVSHTGDTVKVNDKTVTSGSTSDPVSLKDGDNTITVTVTGEDGQTVKSYIITVTRSIMVTVLNDGCDKFNPNFYYKKKFGSTVTQNAAVLGQGEDGSANGAIWFKDVQLGSDWSCLYGTNDAKFDKQLSITPNTDITFWVYVSDKSLISNTGFELGSSNIEDQNELEWNFNDQLTQNGWNKVTLHVSTLYKESDTAIDLSNIVRYRIGFSSNSTTGTMDVALDSIKINVDPATMVTVYNDGCDKFNPNFYYQKKYGSTVTDNAAVLGQGEDGSASSAIWFKDVQLGSDWSARYGTDDAKFDKQLSINTNTDITLWVYVSDMSAISFAAFEMGSSNIEDQNELEWGINDQLTKNGWNKVTLDVADKYKESDTSIDLSNVVRYRMFFLSNRTTGTMDVALDSIKINVKPSTENQYKKYPVSLQIGANQTQRNVVWYNNSLSAGKVQLALKSAMTGEDFPSDCQEFDATVETTDISSVMSNRAIITGLAANTDYVYRVGNDGKWSDVYGFKTSSFDRSNFSFLFAGDTQIGASGNLASDAEGWNTTLNKAQGWFPDEAFLISAGDQVEISNSETEYTSFLKPDSLRSLTLAPNIGDHDSGSTNYSQHFFVPNEAKNSGDTSAGGDYWYTYNNVLFMSLNSNNLSTAQHQAFLKKSIEEYKAQNEGKDPAWKLVTFHHSVYSIASHAQDSDILQRRNELTIVFRNLGIDAVLMGHDHVYARSLMMNGTTPVTTGYTQNGDSQYASYSDSSNINETFYLSANSASGSKFYEIRNLSYPFLALGNQKNTPNITKIDVSEKSLTFTTYLTGVNNTIDNVVDTFTLNRNSDTTQMPSGEEWTPTNDPDKPIINTSTLKTGTEGKAYNQTLIATGISPITWSLKSGSLPNGSLPAGLSLTGNTISGTPTVAGTFNFTVQAENTAGSVEKTYEIIINPAPVAPSIIGPTTLTLTVNYAATSSEVLTVTGTAPVAVTKTSGDGKITWNDTTKKLDIAAGLAEGSYPVTLTATNGTLPDATMNFTLTITQNPVAPSITGSAIQILTENYATTSSEVFTVTGTAPLTVTKTSGDEKITWNDTTKKLDIAAGLTAGSYPVTLTAANGTLPDATLTFTLTVNSAPVADVDANVNPTNLDYDIHTPTDVVINITWNSATTVTDVVYNTESLASSGAYVVTGSALTIKNSYLEALGLAKGDMAQFEIHFNKGKSVILTVNVVDNSDTKPQSHSITIKNDGNGTADVSTSSALAGIKITLTAIPKDGYHFKEWQVITPSGITIADNTFTMPNEAVIVKVIFEENPAANHNLIVNGSYATISGAGSYAEGVVVTVNAGSRSDYIFSGWSSADGVTFANPNNTSTTFTMPAKDVNVTASWSYSGGSTGGGDNSSNGASSTPPKPATQSYTAENKVVDAAGNIKSANLPITVDANNGTAAFDVGSLSNLISNQENSVITVPSIPKVDNYAIGIPVSSLSTTVMQGTVTVITDKCIITVPSNMLYNLSGADGSKAVISVGKGNKSGLPEAAKTAIGDRPIIQLSVAIDGKRIEWNNPDAPVKVSIPYTPTASELLNPESILIWYIDGSGKVVSIPNGHYDPTTGTVTFTATHFSYYSVGYNKVNFEDVAENSWYRKAVSFIAARGITTGTGSGNYSPNGRLTRGEFLVMLMKAYGITPDANPKDNFTDAGSTYYTDYLAEAKKLGISEGTGNNMFMPEREISRQEMFTQLYNVLRVINKLPQGDSGKEISDFNDSGKIAAWAKDAITLLVKTGTIGGSAGKLTPTSTTNRAEMAQVLYKLLNK